MTRDELLARLDSVEWDDIEFKEAAGAVPKSAIETVSAFANTRGGHIVFGVSEGGGSFKITGVAKVDKVQNEFLGQTRDGKKISVVLPISGRHHEFPEGTVICFHVPEASRGEKPVYLDRNPGKAFIRRGGGDYRCTRDELMRLIRDAGATPHDSETLDLDPAGFYDESTLRWYRARFEASNPGKDNSADDIAFLRNWGLLVENRGALLPTRAAVLVLGAAPVVRQQLPRIVVDLQHYRHAAAEYSPAERWADRVVVEANLVDAWKAVQDFFLRKRGERPFSVDPATMRRHDDPPEYASFREAAINLLIHQDFGDATLVPAIRFYSDETVFFNPGDAFASREQLLDPGDKDVRNPRIVTAFRQIGLSEQAGTGVAAIFEGWRRLGFLPPEIENHKAKSFRLRLRRERLLNEEQLLAQASLGVSLSEAEAAVFAFLTRKGEADIADIKALTGLSGPESLALAQRLSAQVILRHVPGPGARYALADHLRERYQRHEPDDAHKNQMAGRGPTGGNPTTQVTAQVSANPADQVAPLRELTTAQRAIVEHADAPRSMAELMRAAGYVQRQHFKTAHLEPLIAGGVLRMTVPDKPTSSRQKYVLTPAGLNLKALRLGPESGPVAKDETE